MMATHTYLLDLVPMSTNRADTIIHVPVHKGSTKKRGMIIKTKEARAWMDMAVMKIRQQRLAAKMPTIEGPVAVEFWVYRKIDAGDVDNYSKGVLDALQAAHVILNDKLVLDLTVHKRKDSKRPRYEITVTELEAQAVLLPLEERPEKKKSANLGTMVARALGAEPWPADKIPDIFKTQAERDGEQ